jgi:tripartite-type tricarboxylate transporter receptor subunit TctC
MRSKLIAVLVAIVALVGLGVAPAQARGNTVTYVVSIKSGAPNDTFIRYNHNGEDVYTDKKKLSSWSISFSNNTGSAGVYAYTWTYAKPTYACKTIVNGVVVAKNEGVGYAQCYAY